jgi:hypothetical protein
LTLLLCRCYAEDESTFIVDPFDPRVPQYSEEGANTGGAYINQEPWRIRKRTVYSIFSDSPSTIGILSIYIAPDSSGSFIALQGGDILSGPNQSGQSCSVGFFLKDRLLRDHSDLRLLEGQRINLDGLENFGQIVYDNKFVEIGGTQTGSGLLHIRRVANMGTHFEVSGTFGFAVSEGDQEITVFSGRFDYEVKDEHYLDF